MADDNNSFEVRSEAGYVLVTIQGAINTATSHEYKTELKKLASGNSVILDLAGVTMMSSTFIGTLFELSDQLSTNDKKLILSQPSRRAVEILKLTGLIDVFEICNTEAAALEAVGA